MHLHFFANYFCQKWQRNGTSPRSDLGKKNSKKDIAVFSSLHETVHTLPKEVLDDLKAIARGNKELQEMSKGIVSKYKTSPDTKNYTEEDFEEEAVARFVELAVTDPEKTLKLIQGKKENALEKIIKIFKGFKKSQDNLTTSQKEGLNKIYNRYVEALKEEQSKRSENEKKGEKTTEKSSNLSKMDKIQFSLTESYEVQVDKALSGGITKYNSVLVKKDTPKLLAEISGANLPMVVTVKHLKDINTAENKKNKNYHGIDIATIKELPELLDNPVMVMESLTHAGSLVVVTSGLDQKNRPIIVAIKPNRKELYNEVEIQSNFIASFYGRNNFLNFVKANVEKDTLLFIDNKKSHNLFQSMQVQFLHALNKYDFDIIIREFSHKVNTLDKKTLENKEKALKKGENTPEKSSNLSKADKIQYSLSEDFEKLQKVFQNYNEKSYNNYGWAVINEVLSLKEIDQQMSEYELFNRRWAEIKNLHHPCRRSASNHFMIEIRNKMVYTKGTWENPIIDFVVELNLNNNENDLIMEVIYDLETHTRRIRGVTEIESIEESLASYEEALGYGYFTTYEKTDFPTYNQSKEEFRRTSREAGRENSGDAEKANRSGRGENLKGSGENSPRTRFSLTDDKVYLLKDSREVAKKAINTSLKETEFYGRVKNGEVAKRIFQLLNAVPRNDFARREIVANQISEMLMEETLLIDEGETVLLDLAKERLKNVVYLKKSLAQNIF